MRNWTPSIALAGMFACLPVWAQQTGAPRGLNQIQTYTAGVSAVSPPLGKAPPLRRPPVRQHKPLFRLTVGGGQATVADRATQSSASNSLPSSTATNFEGISADVNSPLLSPPDENLAVGPGHIVQTVNMAIGVYGKNGSVLAAPTPIQSLWGGSTALCATQAASDPVVRYDRAADRWIVIYITFDFSTFFGNFHTCMAVSQTGDPAGSYYLYDVDFGYRLQDYIKLAVWTDGWYTSANSFLFGFSLEGSNMCAWERAKFLVGDTTGKVICVVTGSSAYAGLLASDWDGATSPPVGSPNYLIGLYTTSSMAMFRMKPNYANPSSTQVTGPISIGVSQFNLPCGSGGDCIPQKDTSQLLASVGERLMHRLAYRNFGTHESIVANHSVETAGRAGIRWYEIRSPGGTPVVYQQGTYSPDADHRWMASIAMDKAGNIGVGYSKSSATMYPGIFYTGREPGDPPNTLAAEQTIWLGSGSQLPGDSGSNRWGDYSSIETDPVDDCTFWYTSEYLPANGTFNWRTRIASFKFPSCGSTPVKIDTTTTISSVSPEPSVTGQSYTVSYNVAPLSGSGTPTGTVTVSEGTNTCSGPAPSGSCALSAATAGVKTLTAAYGGDTNFNSSVSGGTAHAVDKAATAITITSDAPDPSTAGQSYTVAFTLTVNSPGAGTPGGNVTINDGHGVSCTAPAAASGSCALTSTFAGTVTLTATYGGDANFLGSSDIESHLVNPASSVPPAPPTNLIATPVYGTQGRKTVLVRIDLSWMDNATNEDNFPLERYRLRRGVCSLETTFTVPAHTGTGTTAFVDTTASSSTCKYRVAARNTAGTSTYAEVTVSP